MDWLAGVRTSILAAVDFTQNLSTSVLLVVGVVTVVAALRYRSYVEKVAKLPPGPRNLPILGALLEMEPFFHKTLEKFATKYGPIMHFRLGVQNVVVVSSAEAAEDLVKHRDAEFSDRTTAMNISATKYIGLGGISLAFLNYNAEYKLLRKIMMTDLFTTASIKSYEKLRTQDVAVMVETVFGSIQNADYNEDNPNSHPQDIRSIACAMIRNMLSSRFIGKRFDSLLPTDELRAFPEILQEATELVMKFNLVDFFPWLTWLDPQGLLKSMKSLEKRHRTLYRTIVERCRRELMAKRESSTSNNKDRGSSENFVEVLLDAQENGSKITDDGVIVAVRDLFSAGIDTTGTQIAWVLVELVRHPKVLQRLQHEVDAVVGRERPLEEADLQSMPFLNAVILETLRLHPIAPHTFPHVNHKPSSLCGYDIPANTAVFLNIWSIARDPNRWKDPLQFNPDRFIADRSSVNPTLSDSEASRRADGNCYYLLPFGSGRRACPGYNLAILLLCRIVGSLVHAFDWSPPEGCSLEDVSIEELGVFIIRPASSLFVPTPRLLPHVYKSSMTRVPTLVEVS